MGDIILGGTVISDGVMLAPMAGAADHAMRSICRAHGAPYAVTEMVSAKAMMFRDRKTAVLAAIKDDDRPLAVQIFGSDAKIMATAAYELATCSYPGCETKNPPSAIDINMGCPVNKIVSNGEGSALMKRPELAEEIVTECVRALDGTGIPVTVKIRAGWETCPTGKNAVEIAKRAEAAGASMICVHGRTREQFYSPPTDLDIIRDVKRAVSIPVIGNGDIKCGGDAVNMIEYTGCDGVAVGRGALGNPFIFDEIICALHGREYTPPTVRERIDEAVKHTTALIEEKGERVGMLESRKHFAWYITGMRGAPQRRDRIMRAETYEEMKAIVYELCRE